MQWHLPAAEVDDLLGSVGFWRVLFEYYVAVFCSHGGILEVHWFALASPSSKDDQWVTLAWSSMVSELCFSRKSCTSSVRSLTGDFVLTFADQPWFSLLLQY